MTLLQIAVLALIQGLTEFLPVSSSAHLILVSRLFHWPDQGLELDVAVHLGTLIAVLIYFRHDFRGLISAWQEPANHPVTRQRRRVGLCLVLGTVPVVLVGGLFYEQIAGNLRNVRVIAVGTVLFGLLLLLVDRYRPRTRELRELTLRDGVLIGLAQTLALIPGVSRSGATLTMGRWLQLTPEAAARFSFLLSVPVIALAGVRGGWALAMHGSPLAWSQFLTAIVLAALAGWFCIAAFLSLLRRVGLLPFIVYRLALGLVLLGLAI